MNQLKLNIKYLLPLLYLILTYSNLYAQLNIENIEVKALRNQLEFICQFENLIDSSKTINHVDFEIWSTKNGIDTFELIVLNAELKNESQLFLSAQVPLQDAIYGSETRNFIVNYIGEDVRLSATKASVLGNVTQVFDLRPYTSFDKGKALKFTVFCSIALLLIFMGSIPLHYKYFFKKQNIKKYKQIKDDFEVERDPFTYELFQDEHDVVIIDQQVLLLETWKAFQENDEVKNSENYAYLFKKKEGGHFFKPESTAYQYLNNGWFGFSSACLAYIIFQFLIQADLSFFQNYLAGFFDTDRQISTVLIQQLCLGFAFGSSFFCLLTIAVLPWKIIEQPTLFIIKNVIVGMLVCPLIFFEAVFVSSYFNHFVNVLMGWLFLALNLSILTAYLSNTNWKKGLLKGAVLGILCALLHFVFYFAVKAEIINIDVALFLNLAIFGGLLAMGLFKTVQSPAEEIEEPVANTANQLTQASIKNN